MSEFSFEDILRMQRALQDKYQHKWEPICPETGRNKLLWMMGECGEVADILKKRGHGPVMSDPATRAAFVEEMADVLMYYGDIMLCFGITQEELRERYVEKYERNMHRW